MSIIRHGQCVVNSALPQQGNTNALKPRCKSVSIDMTVMGSCMTTAGHTVTAVTATSFDCDGQTVYKADMDKCNFKPYGVLEDNLRTCAQAQGGCQ